MDKQGPPTRHELIASMASLADDHPTINKIEVVRDLPIPGTNGRLEHVIFANHAATVIHSTTLLGRVRAAKDTIIVGNTDLAPDLRNLEVRRKALQTFVGDRYPVFSAIFLAKQPKARLKHFGAIPVGAPAAVVQSISEEHCKAEQNPDLRALAFELREYRAS